MAKKDFALGRENFMLIGISVVVIIIGFALMSGGGIDPHNVTKFNPEVFSARRIKLAPIVTVIGFAGVLFGILWHKKGQKAEE
ncbi:MAG: DUF3098 domain-containing protein [Tannerella sp.]|jgi:hypothetical protein|nr:DUF3098 domain-containing protein [Tannerella sp.]